MDARQSSNYATSFICLAAIFFSFGSSVPGIRDRLSGREEAVLEKMNDYFDKSFRVHWQVRCREDINQVNNSYYLFNLFSKWELLQTNKTTASYEYHLRLKGIKVTEERNFNAVAGENVRNRGKETEVIFPYHALNVILNPMDYLARIGGGKTSYRVDGREKIGESEAWIVRFNSAIKSGGRLDIISGTLWIHPDSGAVLKMSLNPESWRFFENKEIPNAFDSMLKRYGIAPAKREISWEAEFGLEAEGIHFPSRVTIIEAYNDGLGNVQEANAWTISYSELRFETSGSGRMVDPDDPILKKAADYCERLKTVALHYVCDEHVEWASYIYRTRRYKLKKTVTKNIVYDYQLIKKDDQLEEKRKALKVDGKAWTNRAEPEKILPYQARYIVYGPIGFLSHSWQESFDYFEEGEEKLEDGKKLKVLISQPDEYREENGVYGRLMIDPESGAVRRISWDPESIDFFHSDDVPETFRGLRKQLIWTGYYDIEKNGIFFPSRQVIREEYVEPGGEVILGNVWTVTYENYRFFTVGVDIEIKK